MSIRHIAAALCLTTFVALNTAEAGRRPGPGIDETRCEAYSSVTYHDEFYGGELAEVLIIGDGDTDLDLFVYDENGNLIVSDTGSSDVCHCQWNPRWTGVFRIEVHNLGDVWNAYTLETN
jgi:hypothetical protein